jgi:nicotinamide-nucleotide amidase
VENPRAAIVVTGSEVVRGDIDDRNGPFLAAELVRLGLEPERIAIVGDRVETLAEALRSALAEFDLVLTSGGLGPTHDDRTVELVAAAAGRALHVDPSLEREIGAVSRVFAERSGRPYADFEPGVRKQATLPDGGVAIGLAGTAPGIVLDTGACVVVVLPGPPRELQRLWPNALANGSVQGVLARVRAPERRRLRLYGASESAVAKALAEVGGEGGGVDVTICARDFEIHVDLFVEAGAAARGDAVEGALLAQLDGYVFARDERPVAELVLEACREHGLTLATAESCTGGMVAEELTAVAGSSDVFVGAVVAYANAVKAAQLGVPEAVLAGHGAVSAESAAAMAAGARERLGADVAVAVTGVAGPGGGTAEKPVGLVFLHAQGPDGDERLRLELPGDRDTIRRRAAVAALHLVRRLLSQSRHS